MDRRQDGYICAADTVQGVVTGEEFVLESAPPCGYSLPAGLPLGPQNGSTVQDGGGVWGCEEQQLHSMGDSSLM